MISDNHFQSLKSHIQNFIEGLSNFREELPEPLQENISEDYYAEALRKLEKRKNKLDGIKRDHQKAMEKFHRDYHMVRKRWKKDLSDIQRSIPEQEKLSYFGLSFLRCKP